MPLILPALRLVFLLHNAYDTFKTLKPPRPGVRGAATGKTIATRKRDMKGKLAIWVVWVSWTILERIVDNSVGILIPFYSEIKAFVLLFLIVSRAYGAEPIFLHIIRPVLKPYTGLIDTILDLTAHLGDFLFVLLCFPGHLLLEWWYGKSKPQEDPPPPYPTQPPPEPRPSVPEQALPPSNPPTPPAANGKPNGSPNGNLTEAQRVVMQQVLKQADAVYEGIEEAQQRVRDHKRQQPIEVAPARSAVARPVERRQLRSEGHNGYEVPQVRPASKPAPTHYERPIQPPQPQRPPTSYREQRIEPARPSSRQQVHQVMPERSVIPERPVQHIPTTRRSSSASQTRSSASSSYIYPSVPPVHYPTYNPPPAAPRTTSSASSRTSSRVTLEYDPNDRVIPGVNDGRSPEFGVVRHIDAQEGIDRPSGSSHRSYDSASYSSGSSQSRTRPTSHTRSSSSQSHQQQQSFPVELEQRQRLLAGSSDDFFNQEKKIADVDMMMIEDDTETQSSTTGSGARPSITKTRGIAKTNTLVPKTESLVPKKRPANAAVAKPVLKRGRATEESGHVANQDGDQSRTESEADEDEGGSAKKKRRIERTDGHSPSSPSRRSARSSLSTTASRSSSTTASSARQSTLKPTAQTSVRRSAAASAPAIRPARVTRPPSRADEPLPARPSALAGKSQAARGPGTAATSNVSNASELRTVAGAGRGAPGVGRGRRSHGT